MEKTEMAEPEVKKSEIGKTEMAESESKAPNPDGANRCVIVGGGQAAAQLAVSLRQQGWTDDILIISAENSLPYHRPPLSKEFLLGEKTLEQLLIRPSGFYEKHNIQFLLNTTVETIDRETQNLVCRRTDSNTEETIAYTKLALCTGSRIRKIPLPGSEFSGVCYLRTLDDVQQLQRYVTAGQSAVIIGGGYIGLETAAVLNKLGMKVTVLEREERLLQRVTAPEVAQFYQQLHQSHGVEIKTGCDVKQLNGQADQSQKDINQKKVKSVQLADGSELAADLVVIGVGILPNVELAKAAGLCVDNGIVVDEYGRTCAVNINNGQEDNRDNAVVLIEQNFIEENIVAAGDCTNHPNALLGERVRLESVPNATEQAKSAAAALMGKLTAYNSYPWFWSNQYDIKLQIAGLNRGYDQVVLRGGRRGNTTIDQANDENNFVAWYLKNGKLLAADCINRPVEFMIARQLLTKGISPAPEQLQDETFDLKTLL